MITSKNNSEHYKWGENCDGWHLAKTNKMSVIQELVPPGRSEVRHYHSNSQQYFYILSGIATIEMDGNVLNIHPGSGVHVREMIPHQLMNNGQSDLEFLLISTPPINGDRICIKPSAQQGDAPEPASPAR